MNTLSLALVSALLTLTIEQAPPANQSRRLSGIEFTGNKFFDSDTLRSAFRHSRIGNAFQPGALEADIEMNLKALLKARGFVRCEFSSEELPEGEKDVRVRIRVNEGPQFRLSKLELRGVTLFPTDDLLSRLNLRAGEIFDTSKLKNGLDQIRQMYEEKGYISWSYLPEQSFDEANQTLAMKFTFVEDIPHYVGWIVVTGAKPENDERIRGALTVKEGTLFRPSALKASVEALGRLGLFEKVDSKLDLSQHGMVHIHFRVEPR
jgi:outer membrane protein insertion porin family